MNVIYIASAAGAALIVIIVVVVGVLVSRHSRKKSRKAMEVNFGVFNNNSETMEKSSEMYEVK